MLETTINDDKTTAGGIGTMLAGRYRILRQLGEGGMGSVWLAEDRQLDNRKVAIKMLPSIVVTDKRAYQQLKSEALVSLKLVHPNIVTLRAFEENNGAPFLVMDYIEGGSLFNYIKSSPDGKLSIYTPTVIEPLALIAAYSPSKRQLYRSNNRNHWKELNILADTKLHISNLVFREVNIANDVTLIIDASNVADSISLAETHMAFSSS